MTQPSANVVGLVPWLPWPLSHWPWWTAPVRAERLALLRIGIALCLLGDIGIHYAPDTFTYFAVGSLGDPAVHASKFHTPHLIWSLLRGVGDPTIRFLGAAVWIGSTCWIVGTSLAGILVSRNQAPANDQTGIARWIWTIAFLLAMAGLWSDTLSGGAEPDLLVWAAPLAGFSLASIFCGFDLGLRWRDRTHRILWLPLLASLAAPLVLTIVGWHFVPGEDIDKTVWWHRALRPWQQDASLLVASMCLWIASAFLLLIGCATRSAAVLTWMLSLSFANLNPHLDNAGDTIRLIVLFYVMLCPCGAVWSIDALWQKRAEPVFVHPWPIRLLFVQMIFIYFMNGLYKLHGTTWLEGSSLYFVLGDISLSRFSPTSLALPYPLTRVMTWTVLVFEVSFPLLVLWKWPRRLALAFGVMFHLGIFATMELAFFALYALCMYLPLLPVERFKSSEPET